MVEVTVHLKTQSQPLVYNNVINTYQKGDLYCIYTSDECSHKFPIADLFRVIEGYGYHGREAAEESGKEGE